MWNRLQHYLNELPPLAWNLLLASTAVISGLLFKWVISFFFRYYSRHTSGFSMFRSFILRLGKPLTFFLPLLILDFMLPDMKLHQVYIARLDKLNIILLIVSFAAVLVGLVKAGEDYVVHAYDLNKTDNFKERKVRTQLQFLRRVFNILIVIVTVCAILLTFEKLRRLGAGLLTGVGVGGIIIGFAAQQSLRNFLAGLQIAFTQPIRIDDVVVVEGEYGRVEEITFTYVVISVWDQRKLIVPINYFIEKPFQNWTRNSAELTGSVFLYLDYTAPVHELRAAFTRMISTHELWDGRVQALQVTNTTDNTMEIRLLMSSGTSSRNFDLRCHIREQMLAFIRENYPGCLPATRAVITENVIAGKE